MLRVSLADRNSPFVYLLSIVALCHISLLFIADLFLKGQAKYFFRSFNARLTPKLLLIQV